MEITKHETQTGAIVINNPTAEAIKLAKQLERKNHAKIRADGAIMTFSAYRRDFEKMMPAAKPVAKPTPVAAPISNSDRAARIVECEAEIVRLQAHLDTLNDNNDPIGIARVEVKAEIRGIRRKIDYIQQLIDGTAPVVTEEQVALSDYALSDKYNDD